VVAAVGMGRVRSGHLERENERLEAEVFSYSVSHDIQAPLRRIKSFSELLLGEHSTTLDDEGRDFLRRIDANARHLRHLVDALLKLSRVPRAKLHREPVDLTSMAEAIGRKLSQGELERTVSFQVEEGLAARGDRHLVELMLRNLLENAWKFTRRNERAVIALERVPGTGEGAGVGLVTVQRIVHRHGGATTGDANPEGGASFTFSLEPPPAGVSGEGQ